MNIILSGLTAVLSWLGILIVWVAAIVTVLQCGFLALAFLVGLATPFLKWLEKHRKSDEEI